KPVTKPHTMKKVTKKIEKVEEKVKAAELLEKCALRLESPHEYHPIYNQNSPPHRLPRQPRPRILTLPDPLIEIRDIDEDKLESLLLSRPITNISGLLDQINFDASLFTPSCLRQTLGDFRLEIRRQQDPSDHEEDKWDITSTKAYTTFDEHTAYMKEQAVKEMVELKKAAEPERKRMREDEEVKELLRFATNIDLDDETRDKVQLDEIKKFPECLGVTTSSDMLCHLGFTAQGINAPQVYLKVKGNMTPAHMENLALISINANLGPGDCVWYSVPYEFWPQIEKLVKEKEIQGGFMAGSWWPSEEELKQNGIPVCKFTQKKGDTVVVGYGAVHWVQALGGCTNISWNRGPCTLRQLQISTELYESNKERNYKSLVPIQSLMWSVAAENEITDKEVYEFIRVQLIKSFAFVKQTLDWAAKRGWKTKKIVEKDSSQLYCERCQIECFAIRIIAKKKNRLAVVRRMCPQCATNANYIVKSVEMRMTLADLSLTFDSFKLKELKTENGEGRGVRDEEIASDHDMPNEREENSCGGDGDEEKGDEKTGARPEAIVETMRDLVDGNLEMEMDTEMEEETADCSAEHNQVEGVVRKMVDDEEKEGRLVQLEPSEEKEEYEAAENEDTFADTDKKMIPDGIEELSDEKERSDDKEGEDDDLL
ncbi:hypothetical protein PFISCL1PPCAC_26306, partial [Pristionchus fissidentatus]